MASVGPDPDDGSTGSNATTPAGNSPPVPVTQGSTGKPSSKDALNHVLDNLFGLPRDNGLRKALQAAGYFKIPQILYMSSSAMKSLSHKTQVAGKPVTIGLLTGEAELLEALQGFAAFMESSIGHPLSSADWMVISEEEFDEYQGSVHSRTVSPPAPMPTPVNVATTPVSTVSILPVRAS
jgi:hypothetical protein